MSTIYLTNAASVAAVAMEHRWVNRPGVEWTFCADCNVVQRADGKNRPCRGPVGLTLRGGSGEDP